MAQTFNPDNVMVYENKDGSIPEEHSKLIIGDVMEQSKIMQLGVFEEMNDQEKTFDYLAEGPGAYWVNETEKIQTSKPKFLQVTMRAHKLGVILPVSREFLYYKMSDFFEEIRPRVAEAFYKKFDAAGILNVSNPYANSVDQAAAAAKNVVKGDITYDNILNVEDALYAHDEEANAWISKVQNNTALRGAVDAKGNSLFDRSQGTLDGLPIVNLKNDKMDKGTLFAGNFDHLRYGIPYDIEYQISEDAQLSTITNEDGSPVNLFEQEMVALRATMDVAMMIVKDGAFAKLQPAGTTKP